MNERPKRLRGGEPDDRRDRDRADRTLRHGLARTDGIADERDRLAVILRDRGDQA